MPYRETRQLSVIKKPAPGTRTVLAPEVAPAVKGVGTDSPRMDYTCGSCRVVLLESIQPDSVTDMVIRCPGCGVHNQTLT